MSSIPTHFVIGASLALPVCRAHVLAGNLRPWAIVVSAGVLATLADADTVYWRKVAYADFLGHRGFWHSPFFLILLSCVCALALTLLVRSVPARSGIALAGVWSLSAITHPILDAMTHAVGAEGVMLGYPLSRARFFLPWQPMLAAKVRPEDPVQAFLDVFATEWPFCLAALAIGLLGHWRVARARQ